MLDQGKLQLSIEKAIRPYTSENGPFSEDGLTNTEDPFAVETAAFLTRELVDANVSITEEQAELDDEELESLPVAQVLVPYIEQLISPKDPLSLVASIVQIYTVPDPEPETHAHIRYGSCEVPLPHDRLRSPSD